MRLGKSLLKSAIARECLSWLAVCYVHAVHLTIRWRHIDPQHPGDILAAGGPIIPLFWHGRLLMMPKAWLWPERRASVMISRHGDGDLIARTIRRLGIMPVRGSTERSDRDRSGGRDKGGAAAMLQLFKLLRENCSTALTPDGPRGPRMRLSRGVVELARLSGVPMIPASYATERRILLNSWDRFHVPLPFTRGVVVYGAPIRLPRELDEAEREAARLRIEAALNAVTWESDRLTGHEAVQPAAPAAGLRERQA